MMLAHGKEKRPAATSSAWAGPAPGRTADYHGHLAHQWPNGVNQVPALVGTVIRTAWRSTRRLRRLVRRRQAA